MAEEDKPVIPGNMHEIQKSILKSLGYRNRRTFSELQGGQPSNKLSFHLNKLSESEIIEKDGKYYRTTEKGKSILADLKFGSIVSPIDEVMVIVYSDDEEILLQYNDDNMDPLAECYRPLVDRLVKSERVREKARDMVEETITPKSVDIRFAGILDMKTLFDEERFQQYMNLVILAEAEASGSNFYSISEIENMKLVPGLEDIINVVIDEENLPFMAEWDLKSTDEGFQVEDLTL